MENISLILVANAVSLAFAIGSIYLASIGFAGWGWFVFASILAISKISIIDRS
jgi:hypothetical protein